MRLHILFDPARERLQTKVNITWITQHMCRMKESIERRIARQIDRKSDMVNGW